MISIDILVRVKIREVLEKSALNFSKISLKYGQAIILDTLVLRINPNVKYVVFFLKLS